MNSLTTSHYFYLVSKLPTLLQPPLTQYSLDSQNGILEFISDNIVIRLTPYWNNNKLTNETKSEPDALILDANLMLLDLNNREVNHDRFLILHQLNGISRYSTGMISFISEQGMLSLGKVIPITSVDQPELLASEVKTIIHAANDLYDQWNELGV